jgi:hypothetical protein
MRWFPAKQKHRDGKSINIPLFSSCLPTRSASLWEKSAMNLFIHSQLYKYLQYEFEKPKCWNVTRNSKYTHNSGPMPPKRSPLQWHFEFWVLKAVNVYFITFFSYKGLFLVLSYSLCGLIYLFSRQVNGSSYLTFLWLVQHFKSHIYIYIFCESLWIAHRNFNMCCMWCKTLIHIGRFVRINKINCIQHWKISC